MTESEILDARDNRLIRMRGPWYGHGSLIDALCDVRGNHASDYHDAVEQVLLARGWSVRREYAVASAGRGGRIDLVGMKGRYLLALELDNRTPRGRSIEKLEGLGSQWMTGVLLRNPR